MNRDLKEGRGSSSTRSLFGNFCKQQGGQPGLESHAQRGETKKMRSGRPAREGASCRALGVLFGFCLSRWLQWEAVGGFESRIHQRVKF